MKLIELMNLENTMRDRFKQDIIEAYCEGFTSTEIAEQYYERRYNDTDSNSHT